MTGGEGTPAAGVPLEVVDGVVRAVTATDAPAAPPWFEDPAAGVRVVPAVTDAAVRDAVLIARAVVKLDDQRWRLTMQAVELRGRLDRCQKSLDAAQERNKVLQHRLQAVQFLHAERERLVPGALHADDTEGTGVCGYCGNLWPCRTFQAAAGGE